MLVRENVTMPGSGTFNALVARKHLTVVAAARKSFFATWNLELWNSARRS